MTFGDYSYGPDELDESAPDQAEPVHVRKGELVDDPDHPLSDTQCDHPNCKQTVGDRQRVCDDCIIIMQAESPDRCSFCGATLS
jgi:hypothetical protein